MAVLDTRSGGRDEGFSMVEVMVVVLILGVLISMASAVFLLPQEKAKDAAAKSLATNGLQAQKTYLAEKLEYATAEQLEAADIEPTIEFESVTTAPSIPTSGPGAIVKGKVYIRDADGTTVELVAKSDSGECFWTKDVNGDTRYARWSCDSPPPDPAYKSSWSD